MDGPHPPVGLRERKKAKTRAAIREHGMRLFKEQGYAETTVDQIAEAAEVSASTFFRYFPTKEAVVLTDDFDPLVIEAFRAQPPELSPVDALRGALRAGFAEIDADAWQRERERQELIFSVPELRTAAFDEYLRSYELITKLIAERIGRDPDDLTLRTFCGALMGTLLAAGFAWASDPTSDYPSLVDGVLTHFAAGLPL
jgi:AcrR family transcriptional regulator